MIERQPGTTAALDQAQAAVEEVVASLAFPIFEDKFANVAARVVAADLADALDVDDPIEASRVLLARLYAWMSFLEVPRPVEKNGQ